METIIISGRRRITMRVPASVSSSSPTVLPSSTLINSSTRCIQGVSCSCISIFPILTLWARYGEPFGNQPINDAVSDAGVYCCAVRWAARNVSAPTLVFVAFENQAGVMSAKAHRVGHGDVDRRLARLVGNVVEIAFRVWMAQVDGRRDDTRLDRHNGDGSLYRACRAQCMPGHRLGGADRQV